MRSRTRIVTLHRGPRRPGDPGASRASPRADVWTTPPRRVDAPAEGHESSCTLRPRAAGGWVVDARVGTVATPSEGGVRFELRGVELDASGERAPADAECIVYVSEPGCTFGGSCASDCVVGATLEGDTFVGTVYCARLRCGDLFSVGSADVGGGEGASFSFSGCSGT